MAERAGEMNNIANWRVEDPAPNEPDLGKIVPLGTRADALIARKKAHPILATNFIRVRGAADFIKGLDYHHTQYMAQISVLASAPARSERTEGRSALSHEAVAYFNRMGQFHAFAKSKFVKQHLGDLTSILPSMTRLLPFRNKHVAHRSIDVPNNDDTPELQVIQAYTMSTLAGSLFEPRTKGRPPDPLKDNLWQECFFKLQIRHVVKGQNTMINFTLETEHAQVVLEAYSVLDRLLA